MGNPQEGFIFRPPLWYNKDMVNPCYIAGLIDGEGYLGIIPSRVNGLINKSFEPVVKIGMTGEESRQLFERIQQQYGGTIEKRYKLTKGNRTAYTIVIKSRKRVLHLLEDIIDELVIKQSQALLLKEFCELPMTHTRHASYDPAATIRKQELYEELKRLKQPPATTK